MLKSIIRQQALQFRKALSADMLVALNQQLLEQFKQIDLSGVKILHTFLPIAEKNEPDTFLIIEWVKANYPGIKILVPRADFDRLLMTHHEFIGHEDLQRNIFNILEPQQGKIYEGKIDIVLVPLLGFDLKGNRVGYGKGFYDRFLATFEVSRKIGVTFSAPVRDITDAAPHDIQLDECLTPQQRYIFKNQTS